MARQSWTDFWQRGELTTLTHFRDGYSGELAAFWHALVERLADGARVVDLATGNGAVPMVLLQHARTLGLRLELEGVDVAGIDPVAHAGRRAEWLADLATIRFHAGTPLERTGLASSQYHLVTSQYGIEYGDLDAAADEIARLLKPGGLFGAIIHSADSNVAITARRLDELLGLLLGKLDIPGRVRDLLGRVGAARDEASMTRLMSQPENARAYDGLLAALAQAERVARQDEERYGTLNGFATSIMAPLGAALSQ
jgi:SAM-dependent methyltransferase